jgi:hypothetical protein
MTYFLHHFWFRQLKLLLPCPHGTPGAESDEEIRRVPKMGGASASASSGAGAEERPKGDDGKQGQVAAGAQPPVGGKKRLLRNRVSLLIKHGEWAPGTSMPPPPYHRRPGPTKKLTGRPHSLRLPSNGAGTIPSTWPCPQPSLVVVPESYIQRRCRTLCIAGRIPSTRTRLSTAFSARHQRPIWKHRVEGILPCQDRARHQHPPSAQIQSHHP